MADTVVAAAVIRDGRVLATRRTAPAALAGRWEFPGGKVERGETDAVALVRELREELRFDVAVGAELGRTPIDAERKLVLYRCTLTGDEPQPGSVHDRLQWVSPDELDTLSWLAADLVLLPSVVAQLRAVT